MNLVQGLILVFTRIGNIVEALRVGKAGRDETNSYTKAQRGTVSSVPYAASMSLDMTLSNNFSIVLGGDVSMAAPTGLVANELQGGLIFIKQDATGSRAATWSAEWLKDGTFSEDTASNKTAIYQYTVISTTQVLVQYLRSV